MLVSELAQTNALVFNLFPFLNNTFLLRTYVHFSAANSDGSKAAATRGIDVDDIAEIRRGQITPKIDSALQSKELVNSFSLKQQLNAL